MRLFGNHLLSAIRKQLETSSIKKLNRAIAANYSQDREICQVRSKTLKACD